MHHYTENHVFCENENIAVVFHPAHNEEIHIHDFVELVYIAGGRGHQYIDGKKYSGSVEFHLNGSPHSTS